MQPKPPTDPFAIEALKRQARRLRIEANRASASLARQFLALADLYETQAQRLEDAAA